jgi:rhodanese-related sulfurtransferase
MKDNQLLNGAIIFFLVIMIGIVASGFIKSSKKHKVANQDVLENSINDDFLLKYNELSTANLADFLFVDLRTEKDFNEGHLQGAINLSPETILEGESLKTLRKSKKPVVLYSDSQAKSVSVNMLLQSAGIKNIRVLAGNYSIAKNNAIDGQNLEMLRYDEEKAQWNYGAYFKTTPAERNEPPITPAMLQLQGGC